MSSAPGTLIGVAFLAWLAAAAAIPAHAHEITRARKAIEAQYARLDAALTHKRPIDAVVTRDFRFVDASGDEWGSPWAPAATRSTVQSVAIKGNIARTVVSTVRELTGQGSKYRVEQITHDAWVKIGSKWRLRRSAVAHSKTWVNDNLTEDVTARPPLQPSLRDAIIGELRARAVPVKTVMPGAGFDDLAALDQIVGDARIVALGEA